LKLKDLIEMYEVKKREFGGEAYKHISELLSEAKEIHKRDFLKNPTPGNEHEQSWRAFKGKNLQKLIAHIIKDGITNLGLKLVD